MAQQDTSTVSLRLDDEDARLLAGLMEVEKLSKSDVIRRALRAYAKKLGVLRANR